MILDTSALSDFLKNVASIEAVVRRSPQPSIPVIVLGEYRFGLRASRYRAAIEAGLDSFLLDCTVLDVDQETADYYADVRSELKSAGTPIPENDVWIAALARQHNLPILTRDAHFDQVKGLKRFSW